MSPLTLDVFNTGYTPVNGGPGWNSANPATWPACTTTLISGEQDAVLVDALMTFKQGHDLAAWIHAKDKHVSTVVVTHGHGDHFFGAAEVLEAFPGAAFVAASAQVIDEARGQTKPDVLQNWTAWFGDQYDHNPPIPTLMTDATIDLEGHTVAVLPVGAADGVLATIVHLAELETICSGDAVYNDIHMWLWNSTPESRASWLDTIDAIAAMQPATIIAGHRDPAAPDDDARRLLAQSRCYVEDFDLAMTRASTAADLIDSMMARYANFGNPYTLFLAAHSQFPQ